MKHLVIALALAYIMPASSVLRRVANGRDDLSTTALKAEGVASVAPLLAKELAPALGSAWASGEWTLNATLSIRFPSRCRLELAPTDSTKGLVIAWANGKKRNEGPTLAAAEVALTEVCSILAQRSATEGESRAAIERHLSSLKIESRQVSLGRFEGTVVFVLGEKSEGASHFEVYKERFLPARVVIADGATPWDVRFIDYSSQSTGEWLPRVIEVWRGKDLYFRFTVMSADGKANLEATRF